MTAPASRVIADDRPPLAPNGPRPADGAAAAADPARPRHRSVTWRSVSLGTLAALAVCVLTPLNDYVLSDTSLCAGFVPLIAVLILFLLVVGINAPLHRWLPRHALATGELAVVVLMTLVACGLPNWGLARFLTPTPVYPFHVGATDSTFWNAFLGMDLPKWLFPVADVKSGRSSTTVLWFYNRVPEDGRIPWGAWVRPMLSWGVFAAAMLATLAAMARLVIDQWALNERLPFPLVQVQAALIEPPAPGRALNAIFRSPLLWIGLCGVFAIHSLSILNAYFPRHVPVVPLHFDLTNLFADEPFSYLRPKLKAAMLSFTVVGVTFFIRSRAAFSLWFFFLVINVVELQYGMRQGEFPTAAWQDQHLGAAVAFVIGILWIGRHHWAKVLRAAVGLGADRAYRWSFWVAVAGIATMYGWLCVVGVGPAMAAAIVGFIVGGHAVVARVVAETGLPFYRTGITAAQVYSNVAPRLITMKDVFFSQVFNSLGPLTTRDSVAVFATTGLGVAGGAGVESGAGAGRPVRRRALGGVIAWTLLLGGTAAVCTTLYCQYSYPTPAAQETTPRRNYFGAEFIPRRDVAPAVDLFTKGKYIPKQHNPYLHMGIGFVGTVLLEVASLRYAGWPLLPVGYVASYGAFVENAWFSILVGWLAQVLIVRFGGGGLFQKAKPFFIGIIFGESLAAGLWLILNAIIVLNGGVSQSVKFLL